MTQNTANFKDKALRRTDFEALWALVKMSRDQQGKFAFSISLIILSNASAALGAFYVGRLIQDGLMKSDYNTSINLGSLVLLLEIAMIALYYF